MKTRSKDVQVDTLGVAPPVYSPSVLVTTSSGSLSEVLPMSTMGAQAEPFVPNQKDVTPIATSLRANANMDDEIDEKDRFMLCSLNDGMDAPGLSQSPTATDVSNRIDLEPAANLLPIKFVYGH